MHNYKQLSLAACQDMVFRHHYLGRLPVVVKYCYGVVNVSPYSLLACSLFSQLTGRLISPNALELTRLVRLPDYEGPLTKLVSKAAWSIRSLKIADLLLSFADTYESHHGGIYQACSWVYDGMREERLDGFTIDGEFIAARTCNSRYGTSAIEGLQGMLHGKSVEPHFDAGKHCYWKALTKSGMKSALEIGLRSDYYPKPALSENENIAKGPKRKGRVELPAYLRHMDTPADSEYNSVGGLDVLE